jgi:hypothetical protein
MAMDEAKTILVGLSDSDLIVSQWKHSGRNMLDLAGEELDEVDDLGLGAKNFSISVDTLIRIMEDTVYLS